MAKEAYYFSHDYHARNDRKLVKLRLKLGQEAKGIYWDLVEMLYEEGGKISLTILEDYAEEINCDIKLVRKIISDFGLFKCNEIEFWSDSIMERIKMRDEKKNKAIKSAEQRWNKYRTSKESKNNK